MNKLHQELIDLVVDERAATSEEKNYIQWALREKQDILNAIHHSPTYPASIKKYIIPISQRTQHEYIPDLENAREEIKTFSQANNITLVKKTIDYIFNTYKSVLSFNETITLYLYLIHFIAQNTIDDALVLLEYISPYESNFSFEQKDFFLDNLALTCFDKAENTGNAFFYQKTSEAIQKLWNMDRTNEYSDFLGDRMFEFWRYQKLLYMKIESDYQLWDYSTYDMEANIDDFFVSCTWDPNKKTYDEKCSLQMILAVLLIQWSLFEKKEEYDKAISSYQNYLYLDPKDLFVQKIYSIYNPKNLLNR